MKKSLVITTAIASLLILSCKNESKTEETFHEQKEIFNEKSGMEGHTSINSLFWKGTYEGTLPFVDCDGLFTEPTINNNETFVMNTTRITDDKKDKATQKGLYQGDESGYLIAFEMDGTTKSYWVGHHKSILLNQEEQSIAESKTENYFLFKKPHQINRITNGCDFVANLES